MERVLRRRIARAVLPAMLLGLLAASPAGAQQILMDRGTRVEGLWCFPSVTNPSHYYYLPSTAGLATDKSGKPKFSFLRYVINRAAEAEVGAGITQAEGGGILHFLVTYDTPERLIRKAEQALRAKIPDDDAVSLRGPVIFKEGRYALISSIINPKGQEETRLLATGNAPVLEGSQLALSFDLPPDRATLLLESLKMASPDISLVFEMTAEGLTDAFDAELTVKWDEVSKNKAWDVGVDLPLWMLTAPAGMAVGTVAGGAAGAGIGALFGGYGAPIGAGIGAAGGAGVGTVAGYLLAPQIGGSAGGVLDELMESQAVELKTRGTDPKMEALLDTVYARMIELMFEPVPIGPVPAEEAGPGGGMNPFEALLGGVGEEKEGVRRPLSSHGGATVGYRTKEIRKSGRTVVNLKKQMTVERVTTLGMNVEDLWSRHGDDKRFFKTVNLADPAFQQREIHVGIDGAILPEFEKFINSVTTTLRKRHQNGKVTLQEIVVDRETFNASENDFRMIYGWNGDEDRTAWLEYEYQTRWSFKGGGAFETPWRPSEANMIDLYAPYRRKLVRVLGDHELLQEQGVRAVVVHVDYPFFSGRKKDKLRLRADQPIQDRQLELTLPLEEKSYHYRIVWIASSGERRVLEGTDSTGLLFVDEMPPPDQTAARAH